MTLLGEEQVVELESEDGDLSQCGQSSPHEAATQTWSWRGKAGTVPYPQEKGGHKGDHYINALYFKMYFESLCCIPENKVALFYN